MAVSLAVNRLLQALTTGRPHRLPPPRSAERWRVRLQPSNEVVEVRASELGEPQDLAAAARSGGGGGPPSSSGRGSERARERSREGGGGGDKRERDRDGGGGREQSRERNGGDAKRRRGDSRERERERERERGGDGSSHHHHHHRDAGRHGEKPSGKHSSKHRHRGGGGSSSDSDGSGDAGSPPPPPPRPTWLAPLIRVRVLDKRLHGGAAYLKKGVVLDVHPGGVADVALPEGRGVAQLRERDLETVVPREPGAPVQVVAGPLRGRRGRLLQAARGGGGGAAAVQLTGDMAIVRLALDDVAEYTGALEEEDE
jgi:G patch domain/KOW motif-containing protein